MSVNTPAKLTIKDYKSELHNDWCPGCGDFGILTGIQMALSQLQLDPDKVAVFSGIGCSGKTPHYINAYGFHTLHGRVLTVATGARLVNTGQTVLALGGDGDGYGIGAGYFVGAGRRNVDFAYIVHNNNVYGLTKGQASPTLSKGKKTKSRPEQATHDGINPVAMAVASGYTFIARAYALEGDWERFDIIARELIGQRRLQSTAWAARFASWRGEHDFVAVRLEHVAQQTADGLFVIANQDAFEIEKRLLGGTIEQQGHGANSIGSMRFTARGSFGRRPSSVTLKLVQLLCH